MESIPEKLLDLESSISTNNYNGKASWLLKEVSLLGPRDEDTEMLIIFLNFILGNYCLSKFTTTKIPESNKEVLAHITQKANLNPYSNIKNELNSLIISSDISRKIVEIFNSIYLLNQKNHIESYYSKIKIKNLEPYFGQKFDKKIIENFGWKITGEYVEFPKVKAQKNAGNELSLIADLQFIGKMNIKLEKFTHENLKIKEY